MFDETRTRYFPAQLVPGVTARAASRQTIEPIWGQLSERIETPFVDLGLYEMPGQRQQRKKPLQKVYRHIHREYFVFYAEDEEPVGWSTGEMHDADTFFMAWSAVLPSYRRRGIYSVFLRLLLPYLHALGYERVTSNHMVTNRPVLIAKLKAGFHVTAVFLDERFGVQVQLTYFFYQDRRDGFTQAFSLEQYQPPPDYRMREE